jgi:putative Ca2+/H+ antiporter (TMEM165/GDT1 family)
MSYLVLVTFGTIFLSELLGDKSIYTISSLTMRFRPLYVFSGFTVAFMVKMLVAVLLGKVIADLPRSLVTITSTATFFLTALVIWFKGKRTASTGQDASNYFSKAALITFAAILFSEWGDIGQIMAATLAARYRMPFAVWLGGTLALMTKGVLALALGRGLQKHIPLNLLRSFSVALCLILGLVSAIGPMLR